MTSGPRMKISPSSPSGSDVAVGVADLDADRRQRATDRVGDARELGPADEVASAVVSVGP